MRNRTRAIYAEAGSIAGAGVLMGSMMNDAFGYDAVGWVVIPILLILVMLFFYWSRGNASCQ